MKKSGPLEKITSKFKMGLMVLLASSVIGSGCYTTINFPKDKREREVIAERVETVKRVKPILSIYSPYNYNYTSRWDNDGDGIDFEYDPLPYDFGPIIDVNGNGYPDWPDIWLFSPYRSHYSFDFHFGWSPFHDFYSPYHWSWYHSHPYSYGGHSYYKEDKPKHKYRTNSTHDSRLRNTGDRKGRYERDRKERKPRNPVIKGDSNSGRSKSYEVPRKNKSPRVRYDAPKRQTSPKKDRPPKSSSNNKPRVKTKERTRK